MPRFIALSFASVVLCGSALAGAAPKPALMPGLKAPEISIKRWLKGTPLKTLPRKGTVVVEFWATWCGPCVQSIPHVTSLAKANPDVTFLGVSIWEDDKGKTLDEFVAKMGDKMDYKVAYSGNQTGMAESWMKAAAQNGIPSAFVIKDGVVQWVGHPMEMDGPLAAIKSGKHNLAATQKEFLASFQAQAKQEAIYAKLSEFQGMHAAGKHQEARSALAEYLVKEPSVKEQADGIRLAWLVVENEAAFTRTTEKMLSTGDTAAKTAAAQNLFSALMTLMETPGKGDLVKGEAMKMHQALPEDITILAYCVHLHKLAGDAEASKELAKKGLAMLEKDPKGSESPLAEFFKEAAKG